MRVKMKIGDELVVRNVGGRVPHQVPGQAGWPGLALWVRAVGGGFQVGIAHGKDRLAVGTSQGVVVSRYGGQRQFTVVRAKTVAPGVPILGEF